MPVPAARTLLARPLAVFVASAGGSATSGGAGRPEATGDAPPSRMAASDPLEPGFLQAAAPKAASRVSVRATADRERWKVVIATGNGTRLGDVDKAVGTPRRTCATHSSPGATT